AEEESTDELEDVDDDQDGVEDDDSMSNEAVQLGNDNPTVGFVEFIDRIVRAARVYGEIVRARTGNARIDRRLRSLRMIKSIQTYGFLMALRTQNCSDNDFEEILRLLEGFLLRRHICRERSNDNETLFGRLCGVD